MTTKSRSKLIVAKDKNELRRIAAESMAKKIQECVRARGLCTVALSGGTTPGPAYEELGNSDLAEKIPWMEVEFYFADERAVPIDHPDSNYLLVKNTLLRSHPEALGRLYRMPADAADRNDAAARYARRLPHELDLLILGMGADGHTASLFPNSSALDEREQRVVAVTAPKPPAARLTITPPVIEAAKTILMLVTGVEKARMLSRAIGDVADVKACPAQLARKGIWIVDHAAAGNMLNP